MLITSSIAAACYCPEQRLVATLPWADETDVPLDVLPVLEVVSAGGEGTALDATFRRSDTLDDVPSG